MKFLLLPAAIIIAYIIFVFAPAVVSYKNVFCRKDGRDYDGDTIAKTQFSPFAEKVLADSEYMRRLDSRRVTVKAFDGIKLSGDYYRAGNGTLAICFHGYNATPLNSFASLARYLTDTGCDVLLVYERAHGESEGKQSALGLLEQNDVVSWCDWACAEADVKNVFLIGTSMGCASIEYASDRIKNEKVKGLILDCGFSSPYGQIKKDCIDRHLPYWALLPIIALCAKKDIGTDIRATVYSSLEKASVPALFVHGDADDTVPLQTTKTHYGLYKAEKELFIVEGARHSSSFLAGREKSKKVLDEFINKHSEKR